MLYNFVKKQLFINNQPEKNEFLDKFLEGIEKFIELTKKNKAMFFKEELK